MLKVCVSSLLWSLLPVDGFERVSCQVFLVREASVSVLEYRAESLLSGVQGSIQ